MVKILFDTLIGPYQVLTLWVRVNMRAVIMNGCTIGWFNVISRMLVRAGVLSLCRGEVGVSTAIVDRATGERNKYLDYLHTDKDV